MSEHGSDREAQIRERAYALWEEDGRPEGREFDHWERAAQEIGESSPAGGGAADGAGAGPGGSASASVDQRTPAGATRATMPQASGAFRSGSEAESKDRKPL